MAVLLFNDTDIDLTLNVGKHLSANILC